MDSDKKHVLKIIIDKLAETKSKIEILRFLEEQSGRSYENEIDELLDIKNELEELYTKLIENR